MRSAHEPGRPQRFKHRRIFVTARRRTSRRANASLKASRCIQLRSCGEKAAISLTSSAWRLVSVLAKIRPRCVFTVDSAILRLRAVSRHDGFACAKRQADLMSDSKNIARLISSQSMKICHQVILAKVILPLSQPEIVLKATTQPLDDRAALDIVRRRVGGEGFGG